MALDCPAVGHSTQGKLAFVWKYRVKSEGWKLLSNTSATIQGGLVKLDSTGRQLTIANLTMSHDKLRIKCGLADGAKSKGKLASYRLQITDCPGE